MKKQSDARRISKAMCNVDGSYLTMAKTSGIKGNLFYLLYALDDGQFHTQKQICDDWLFPKTTINTLVKECESQGFVTLKAVPGTKRELQICLTEIGKEYAKTVLKSIHKIENRIEKILQEKFSAGFVDELERFSIEFQNAVKNEIK